MFLLHSLLLILHLKRIGGIISVVIWNDFLMEDDDDDDDTLMIPLLKCQNCNSGI